MSGVNNQGKHRFWLVNFKTESMVGSRVVSNRSGTVNFEEFERHNREPGAMVFIVTSVFPLDPKTYRSLVKMYTKAVPHG